MKLKKIFYLLIVFGVLFSCNKKELTYKESINEIDSLSKEINYKEMYSNRRAIIELEDKSSLVPELPQIDKFPLVVDPVVSSSDEAVEIFVSTEKSGEKTDGWLTEVANKFNTQNINIGNGKRALVKIRKIASGTGMEYIASQKYIPDAFTPSNELWIRMIESYGVKTNLIESKLVGNVAGIVLKENLYNDLKKKYSQVDIKTIVNATVNGDLSMGYTNPFASSTGLNFLVSVLYTFAEQDENKMLSPDVVNALETFQKGIPFIAYTTIQMRDSVEKGGSLDAFVLEYQSFYNSASLKTGYQFIPFGVRHDNPLYSTGNINNNKTEVLKKFVQFCKNNSNQNLAKEYGFNYMDNYAGYIKSKISGKTIIDSQKLWKEKKDSSKSIAAVFLCDVSGSMSGEPINNLKKALIEGSKFINKNNLVGLVTFNDEVDKILPIKKFDLNHQSSFIAAVEDLDASGNTAMYNGILISIKMLIDEKEKNPDIRPMLFVLTDGDTNRGLNFDKVEFAIKGVKIPVYTIGYNANISILQKVSSINEAASINAETDDVIYKIGSFFNSQM